MITATDNCSSARGSVFAVVASSLCVTRPSSNKMPGENGTDWGQWIQDRDRIAFQLAGSFKDFDFEQFMRQTRL